MNPNEPPDSLMSGPGSFNEQIGFINELLAKSNESSDLMNPHRVLCISPFRKFQMFWATLSVQMSKHILKYIYLVLIRHPDLINSGFNEHPDSFNEPPGFINEPPRFI